MRATVNRPWAARSTAMADGYRMGYRDAVNQIQERLFREAEAHRGDELVLHWQTAFEVFEQIRKESRDAQS